jgi:hypothetical protein
MPAFQFNDKSQASNFVLLYATITSIELIDAWNAHIIYTFEKKKRITIFKGKFKWPI